MKPAPLLIAGLVASNLVFAGVTLWRPAPPPDPKIGATDPSHASTQSSSVVITPDAVTAWRALRHDDPGTFARNLRNAGLADHLVRAIIGAEVDERFRAREEALAPPRPPLQYWQHDTYREPLETRLARLDLKREKARLRLELLGPEPGAAIDTSIPRTKLELARMITEDYDTVVGAMRTGPWDMLLPVEKSTIETIEADRRRELEALFTPTELTEYQFRTSGQMQSLRQVLATFEPSEAEFRAIYDAGQAFEQRRQRPINVFSREGETQEQRGERMRAASQAQQAAERQHEDDLRRALGEERYRKYQRETDHHLLAVRTLAERAGVPRENAERIHDLRTALAQESARIGADSTSSVETRKAALRALGADFRAQAQTLMGPDATSAYVSSADWLRMMEQGHVITFTPGGWGASGISATPPPARP